MNNLDALANWSQIIALPVAVIALIAAGMSYWQQRRKKELTKSAFRIPLAPVADGYEDKLKLVYDGKPVHAPYLAQVYLQNSGNTPITSSDFAAPFTFRFGEQCRILDAEVILKSPEDMDRSMHIDKGTVVLQPDILNPTDGFALRVLGTRIDEIVVDARIVGIGQILDDRPVAPSARDYVGVALLILVLTSLALVLRSPYIWGFVTAGLLGYVSQRILIFRAKAAAGSSRLR